jgi:hypothetical protein
MPKTNVTIKITLTFNSQMEVAQIIMGSTVRN